VADAAILLQALAGYDPHDPVSVDAPVPDYSAALRLRTSTFRLGIPRTRFYEDLEPEIEAAVNRALAVLGRFTGGMRDIELPALPDFRFTPVESYAYHERHLQTKAELYHPITRAAIESGRNTSASAYIKARRDLDLVRRTVQDTFATIDLLVTPTMSVPPDTIQKALQRVSQPGFPRELRNTQPFSLYGLPSLSLPCGFTQSGLPIGLQITGPRLAECKVLALAQAYERATDWHLKHPALN